MVGVKNPKKKRITNVSVKQQIGQPEKGLPDRRFIAFFF